MHLQQCWQKLKEQELGAQQQNRELLQQFEKAQDSLKEMLVCNAAMKTIRMEYEQYLEERYQCWQQRLTEKTQAAKALRMGECLKSPLNNMEEVTKFSTHQHLNTQGPANKPQKVAATQDHNSQNIHLDYNQDGFSHLPNIQSSWLTHPQSQTVRLPIRLPYQPQTSSHFPQSYLPHSFHLHHRTSTTGHHHLWPRQDARSCASLQTDCPCSCTTCVTGLPSCSEALWGQLYIEEPLPESRVSQDVEQEGGTSRAPNTKSRRGGSRSSHLSQELDVKPVRLSSESGTESIDTRRDSSQGIREKRTEREKRGRSRCISSEKERHSQVSSMTSTAFIIASVAVQSSETDTLSEGCSTGRIKKTRRSWGQGKESHRMEMIAKEGTRGKKDYSESQTEESQRLSEEPKTKNVGNQSADNKSDSGTERSKGNTTESEKGGRNEIKKKQDTSSSEQSSADDKEEEKGHEKHQEDEDGEQDNAKKEENSQADGKLEEDNAEEEGDDNEEKENSLSEEVQEEKEEEEDTDVSVRKNTLKEEDTEEEDEVAEEHEDKDIMMNENCESSASSQEEVDEDEIEKDPKKTEDEDGTDEEEDGEGEEEQRGDKAGKPEESDSDHSIILSKENRYTKMHFTPEKEKRGSVTRSSEDSDSNDFNEDDIESLLAPQEEKKTE
ncbi:high mobility group nucleosome-binding domain-containing protein 5-like [Channa argus]|uniref:high mobility group nucleosome-binding domain-containing protein 5-like n=1 Tax=Channa argus TaxID=215402 RepID=UPI0035208BCF